MTPQFLLGIFQLCLLVGGSLAVALFLLDRIFPPMERTRDGCGEAWGGLRAQQLAAPPATPSSETAPAFPAAPGWLPAYWRANLRLIGPMLLIWLLSFTLPALFALARVASTSTTWQGRRVPALLNGLATGADWMSAASFISMAGALFLLGYEGLAYITGWTGGHVLPVLLLAPYLRKFGQFTIPDFIGARYPGSATRVIAAIASIIISFTYMTAQVTGVGIIMSRFLGLNYMLGVIVGLAAVLLCLSEACPRHPPCVRPAGGRGSNDAHRPGPAKCGAGA